MLFVDAGSTDEGINCDPFKVKQGGQPIKLKSDRELGELMPPATAKVISVHAFKPILQLGELCAILITSCTECWTWGSETLRVQETTAGTKGGGQGVGGDVRLPAHRWVGGGLSVPIRIMEGWLVVVIRHSKTVERCRVRLGKIRVGGDGESELLLTELLKLVARLKSGLSLSQELVRQWHRILRERGGSRSRL